MSLVGSYGSWSGADVPAELDHSLLRLVHTGVHFLNRIFTLSPAEHV